jgi:hypothetical protein
MPILTAAVGLETRAPVVRNARRNRTDMALGRTRQYTDWSRAQSAQIYDEIQRGEADNTWTPFQLHTANQIRDLYHRAIGQTTQQATDGTGGGCDVFRGGHVILRDDAQWYYYWASMIDGHRDRGYERWSSHYDKSRHCPGSQRDARNLNSVELQFEIYFPWNGTGWNWGCVLFGRYQEKDAQGVYQTEAMTWFQTEAHSSTRPGVGGTLVDPIAHVATGFIPYKLTGMNIGPRGRSAHKESDPLWLLNPPAPPVVINDDAASLAGIWGGVIIAVPNLAAAATTACVVCGAIHGPHMSIINKWHRCTVCKAIYCPTCGMALPGKTGFFSSTRACNRPLCVGRTELI